MSMGPEKWTGLAQQRTMGLGLRPCIRLVGTFLHALNFPFGPWAGPAAIPIPKQGEFTTIPEAYEKIWNISGRST